MLRRYLARVFAVLIASCHLQAAETEPEAPILDLGARVHPEIGEAGMVIARDAVASQVGADILAQGGNAVDAAVATGFALAVTFPQAGNIGGGGFMLLHLAEENRTIALDYRELSPAAAHREMFWNQEGGVDGERARGSHQSAGVPGTVAGLVHAQQKYGSLPLKKVLAPAIELADKGFTVGYPLAFSLQRRGARLKENPAAASYYFKPDGSGYQPGDKLVQKDLAWTLTQIAEKGADGFYKGEVAKRIVAEMERGNGLITLDDLAQYQVVERQPVTGTYRGYQVVSMPPPSSGGVHLIQMLNMLEGFDVQQMGHNSAYYIHTLTEVMRRAYADRSKYLGDPDFFQVPVDQLIDKNYAEQLRKTIDPVRATPSLEVSPSLPQVEESPQTTHYTVWDKQGNVVSNTYTLNFSYGSGIAVPGTGFLLNNEMDDFSAKPGQPNAYGLVGGEANAIEPRKRPLSSMTPTMVFKDGKPWMATGSPGGSAIINVVLQTILNTVDFDMSVAEAAIAPRIHHQWLPDRLRLEKGISPDTQLLLVRQGHHLNSGRWMPGRTSTIVFENGRWYGYCDPRWPGGAAIGVK
ncbi:gamma-glutamyltransferase [Porticoccus sp. W117]|uniref:gamma-glutamyltransferase n=1 Tax=Porticoccus sp. W117 TaxID=3054777 RepID=UPI002592D520|nr:gamma-glutamyltransferase [Porticoccus sp. W117]MDM3872275.1 gamma-glutamyltransferase [Porticoccus sp. W117]